ncbi:MAG: RDD family protein [Mycoplasma sp.]|nr:RDD family protein [Mycoplasma sp.]
MTNKKAGFWIRLLYLFIDCIIFCSIAISSSLMCITKTNISYPNATFDIYNVKNDYTYYIWLLFVLILLAIFFIVVPLLFNGKTLGMSIAKLKIDFNAQNKYKVIFKRMELGVFLWMFIVIIFMCFVQPKTINKMINFNYIKSNYSKTMTIEELNNFLSNYKWTITETILYTIPSTISPIVVMIQLFFLISIGFKKNKTGLVDKFTNSQIVYVNKYDKVNEDDKLIFDIKPEENIKYEIIWKD